jgi:hypothetical protein
MKNKFLAVILLFSLFIAINPAIAAKPEEDAILDVDGIYDVPGKKGMKVRVFVHKQKAKPSPTPTPVCNLSDPESNAEVGATGWKLPSSFIYQINIGSVPASFRASIGSIVNNSFNVWTSQLGGSVALHNVGNTNINRKGLDGRNVIAWGNVSGSALGVTYTWYYPSTGEVAEIDTIMNSKVAWSWSDPSGTCAYSNTYDAQNILTHEFGHWFGLDDHYSEDYVNNTMYGYGSRGEIKKDTPTSGDISGLQNIY